MAKKAIDIVKHKCCICGKVFTGYGNNPDPVKKNGRCCDDCDNRYVIPARLKAIMGKEVEV